jgi:pimeloyl-ACP methyl ester carboxylesterase
MPVFAAPPDKFFDSNGARIRYVEEGDGEPALLIHGFTSSVEHGWIDTGAFSQLARHYHVIAFDVRGHGKSGKPHDPKQYGRETVQDVIRLLDHLHIQKAHIVGYSMGGRIVAQLLATKPERFITATLGGAILNIGSSPLDGVRDVWATEIEQGSLHSIALAIWPTDHAKPTEEEIRRFSKERLNGNDLQALAAACRAYPSDPIEESAVTTLRVPVLGIAGTADPALNGLNALKSRLPELQLTVVSIQGAGHMAAFSPEEFVQAIEQFLAAHPAGNVEASS